MDRGSARCIRAKRRRSISSGDDSPEVTAWRIGPESRSGGEPAREQRAFSPLVEARAQSSECVLERWILGEVVLFTGVVGETVQLFADFDFAAHVGPLRIFE